jgi:hypothetical protein
MHKSKMVKRGAPEQDGKRKGANSTQDVTLIFMAQQL